MNHRNPSLGELCLLGRAPVPLPHSEHKLVHPKQLGLKLLQLLGPHNGEKWCKASSLLFLQWPGWLFEVGSLGRENR